ncbi:MAG TPA: hypothetical protein VLE21_06640 [Candidatus Nitrosocosmicus sp.]|nr:hypothetical protein [Candidatus Nitrosocosmicus sp.]
MKYLITPSLLNSWHWFLKSDDLEKARNEFELTLKRVPIPDNQFMRAGREFEDKVQKSCLTNKVYEDSDKKYASCVNEVVDLVKGGIWQVKVGKDINIDGQEFYIYGRLDILNMSKVQDIKFVSTYTVGKYIDNPQTPLYFECIPEVDLFEYIISDGESVYIESYRREDIIPIEFEIRTFMHFLKTFEWAGILFRENWKAKY